MEEEMKGCGWRTIRREAMKRIHQLIKEQETQLQRELTETEFRELLSRELKRAYEEAYKTCREGAASPE